MGLTAADFDYLAEGVHAGEWLASDPALDLSIAILGDRDAPDAARVTTAATILDALDTLRPVLAERLTSGPVTFYRPSGAEIGTVTHERVDAIGWVQVDVLDASRPDRAELSFVTGHPDPYHLYVAALDAGALDDVRGRMW